MDIEFFKYIQKIAKQVVKNAGFKMHLEGTKYWIDAISICVDIDTNKCKKISMTEVYRKIAKKYNTSHYVIERMMRYSYKDLNLEKYFDVSYKITNTGLLFLFKEEVIDQYVEDKLFKPPLL